MTRIDIVVEEPKWRARRGLSTKLKRAARLTLARSGKGGEHASLTLLLSGDDKLRTLNAHFRRKNKPTNVLSFPASGNGEGYLGDVALAYGVTSKEARASGKRFSDHATHLVIHGVLHLVGYDHATLRAAKSMEPLEISILARLGIADPYARPRKPA